MLRSKHTFYGAIVKRNEFIGVFTSIHNINPVGNSTPPLPDNDDLTYGIKNKAWVEVAGAQQITINPIIATIANGINQINHNLNGKPAFISFFVNDKEEYFDWSIDQDDINNSIIIYNADISKVVEMQIIFQSVQVGTFLMAIATGRNLIFHNLNKRPRFVSFFVNGNFQFFEWLRTDGGIDCDPLNNIVVNSSEVNLNNVEINIL